MQVEDWKNWRILNNWISILLHMHMHIYFNVQEIVYHYISL